MSTKPLIPPDVTHKVTDSVGHVLMDGLRHSDGLQGAGLGAVAVPMAVATLVTVSAPVVIGLAALGAVAGWLGVFKGAQK
jgi:hypothetical protein